MPGDTIRSFSKISTNDMLTTLNTTNENAAILMSDLLEITTAINDGEGTLGLLIKDAEMASNIKNTVNNLKNASASAVTTIQDLQKIVSKVDFDESLASVFLSDSISARQIRNTIANLNRSSHGIDSVTY